MSAKVGLATAPTSVRPKLLASLTKRGAAALPPLRKNSVLPSKAPTKASRSPSPSMSAKVGLADAPTSVRPKLLASLTKAGAAALPLLRKNSVLPKNSPTKASRSPSPSMSAKVGRQAPTSLRPKLLASLTKLGARALPLLRKNVLPSRLPTKASRSPSPSMSAKVGLAEVPTSLRPNYLLR